MVSGFRWWSYISKGRSESDEEKQTQNPTPRAGPMKERVMERTTGECYVAE